MKNMRNNITLILLSLLLTTFFAGCFLFPPTNHAPTITSTEITAATVGAAYTYNVEATDPDGDTLTYSLTTKPAGMTINSTTGVINWTPDTIGDYDVSVNVEDGTLNDIQSFIIKVSKSSPTSPPVTPPDNSEEIEYKEVVSKQIDLEIGGVVEVTDESSEIFETRFVVDKNKFKKNNINNKTTRSNNVNVVLVLVSAFKHQIDDYQGFLITPIVVMSDSDDEITGTLEIKYNEDKLSNSGAEKNATVNVYRLKTTGGNMFATGIDAISIPVSGATWEKVSEDKYSDENNIVKISINSGDFEYYYTLTVTNCKPPDNLGNPLPGDLVYRLSNHGDNDNWLPGHVGIYVGEKYHETDGPYNVIEALGISPNKVVRRYYSDITSFGSGPPTYMGVREPINHSFTHIYRDIIVDYVESQVGMPYAIFETFGVYFGWARGDYVKGTDIIGSFNCVGLAEKAYEIAGLNNFDGLVSDYDEGNRLASDDPDAILSPQEQYLQTVPANGIIDQNIPPEISDLKSTPWYPIETTKTVTISCYATDQDQDSLTYIWTIPGFSEPLIKGKDIGWIIPDISEEYTISCKVIDNYGGEDEESIKISGGLEAYTITASAGPNGSISPSGGVIVNEGSDKSFTITPDTDYYIADVLVDGSSIGAVSSHTFTNVTEDHTISATFITGSQYLIQWSTAESNGWANPLGEGQDLFTSTAYDYDSDIYLSNWGKKHVGTDIVAELDENVYSIASGSIVKIARDYSSTSNQSVVIIKHTNSSNESFFAIYGHVLARGDLEVNSELETGEKIGIVKKAGSPVHLHFGINLSSEISDFIFTNSDGQWGWGRIPEFANPSEYGWVDPIDYLNVHSVGNIVSGPVHNLTKDTYYDTIQAALDDANNDNIIEVTDGTYDESITFPSGKNIILQSVNGASSTIIRGDNGSATATFDGSLGGTVLEGFTITHAPGNKGRGIYIVSSNLSVKNSIISDNTIDGYNDDGGGIFAFSSTLELTSCNIIGNFANGNPGNGGGIYAQYGSNIILSTCNISENSSDFFGGGISAWFGSNFTLTDSNIINNNSQCGGGININSRESDKCFFTLDNCNINYNNSSEAGGGIWFSEHSSLKLSNCDINENTSDLNAGGIVGGGNLLELKKCNVKNNSAVNDGGIYLYSIENILTDNTICGNYKNGDSPSLDQQVRGNSGSLYETFKDTNYISAYCGVPSSPVHNLTKDTYYNTIQEALDDADSLGGDTIEVDDGTYNESITFPANKVVTLQSASGIRDNVIIQGANNFATVTTNVSSTGTTLRGFTITHTGGNTGRGIYIGSGNLIVDNCIISGNTSDDSGGGIYNNGSLTINSSTISDNSAVNRSGGISNDGTLSITGSTISDNSSSSYGGGIGNYGSLSITGSTISGNTAGDGGGGIMDADSLYSSITNSTISGNTAGDGGGGIMIHGSTSTITGSTISGNTAINDGGGIFNDISILTITNSTISGNTAGEDGSGIYKYNGTLTIGGSNDADKNTICGNYKDGYSPSLDQQISDSSGSLYETYKDTNYISAYCGAPSGLVHNLTKDTYYNTIQAALDDADSGDTIEVADGTYDESITFPSGKVIILQSLNGASSTTIRGDNGSPTATFDGSLEGPTLEGFTITHASGNEGEGIYNRGDLNIKNCVISGNSTHDSLGGGIYNGGSMTISGSTISDNSASRSYFYYEWGGGGGISNSGTLTITESTISGNSSNVGGGMYNYGTLIITSSIISDNSGGDGGGISNSGTLTITESTISDNSADNSGGGGIFNFSDNSTLTISGCTISGNSSQFGGGISNHDHATLTITESTISGNFATNNSGGICIASNSTLTISGCTISGNSSNVGGGMYLFSSITIAIGGDIASDKNTICGNYKTGEDPSLDQQIRDNSGSLYETYKDTNYISAYCE